LEALNVIPASKSYKPLPAFSAITSALTARAQGWFSCRDLDGNVHNFSGDATKLYKLSADGLTWNDVTRASGGAYATDAAGGWSFTQFNNFVIAVNGVDAPQAYELGTSTNFAALAGSPSISRFCATIRDFVWMGRIGSANNRVKWSGIADPESWAISQVTLADEQDIPDGGYIMGLTGGEAGLILQRNAIKRATFVGPPVIFQFDEISKNIGVSCEGSIAAYENDVFFLSDNGFYHCYAQLELRRIGVEMIDNFFLHDFDDDYPHRVTAAIDMHNSCYVISYPGSGNNGGTPNKGLIYHWPTQRWARYEQEVEMIYNAYHQGGYTVETLDDIDTSLDDLPYSLDNINFVASGHPHLSAFSTLHKSGFFSGANMAATVDTGEFQLAQGKKAFINSLRPMVDGTSATVTVKPITRNLQSEAVTVGSAVSLNSVGMANIRKLARYHRFRIEIAAGGTWEHIHGVDEVRWTPGGQM
jgi:hypothetical protein